jgi:hypothetical protein
MTPVDLLMKRLPNASLVSVGHGSELEALLPLAQADA